MSAAARKFTHISKGDYLAAENDGAWRHEFVNGAVYAMAGASDRHNRIRSNLSALLSTHLTDECDVFDAEMKLLIKSNVDERYYYPDVFVTCEPNDKERYTRQSAVLVVEVLSPSTERIDRNEKFDAYRQLPALLEYGLLSQEAMELELFRRRTGWRREFYQRDNSVVLESVGLTLNISALYRRVTFEDLGNAPVV